MCVQSLHEGNILMPDIVEQLRTSRRLPPDWQQSQLKLQEQKLARTRALQKWQQHSVKQLIWWLVQIYNILYEVGAGASRESFEEVINDLSALRVETTSRRL